MFKPLIPAALALSLAIAPVPSLAGNDGAAIACENKGGRYISGECKVESPPSNDLFGKVIVTAILLMALGFGAPK